MKKTLYTLGIAVLIAFPLFADNAVFSSMALDGKSAAMGDLKFSDSPTEYANVNNISLKLSNKKQLGVVPYSSFEVGKKMNENFGLGFKYITSQDNLQTTKLSFGGGVSVAMVTIGANLNIYNAETKKRESLPSEEFRSMMLLNKITDEDFSAKGGGNGFDIGVTAYLDNITAGYYVKNLGAKLKWEVNGKTDTSINPVSGEVTTASGIKESSVKYDESLEIERVMMIKFRGEKVTVIGEIENMEKINLGVQRNYFGKLDLRAGISRYLKSSDNLKSQKIYSVGLGFTPRIIVDAYIDFGYQMKYFGKDDIYDGKGQDDIAFTVGVNF